MDPAKSNYASGNYWAARQNLVYYNYIDLIVRTVGHDAQSLIDVGTGNSPYLEWFNWIPEKVSVDLRYPYESDTVRGIKGNITQIQFPRKFDICLCLQVLEHVPKADEFAQSLMRVADLVVISVPFKWPEGKTTGHVHDPVDLDNVVEWFGRKPNYSIVVEEPLTRSLMKARRLIAVFDVENPEAPLRDELRGNVRPTGRT